MKRIKLVLLFILCSFTALFYGQDNNFEHEIKVQAKFMKDKVVLRWGATTPSSWLKLNKWGYSLERIKIAINGQRLNDPEKEVLATFLKPLPLEKWKDISLNSDYAAILAQALYGEGFIVSKDDPNGEDALVKIINQSREVEQRFAFGLFAADMDFNAAKMAALGYIDENIDPNTEYLYRISSNVPKDILNIERGFIVVKTDKENKLPKPLDLVAIPQDKSIILTWEHGLFKNLFVAYFLERSEDGKEFIQLNKRPLVNLNNTKDKPIIRMQYIDTLQKNGKKYYYRVKGITSLGEKSPYSDIVNAAPYRKMNEYARVMGHEFLKNGKTKIWWEFKENPDSPISHFQLNQSSSVKSKYQILLDNISKSERKAFIKLNESTNYISISAIGKNGEKTISQVALVQAVDSIPPAIPTGLAAKVDSTGIVQLSWNQNIEKDLLGYRVFRANTAKEEFTQLTISPTERNIFTDDVQLKSLNDKVYYKIVSVDNRYNMSDYSETLLVKKPDIVPPSSPVFKSYKVKQDGVQLTWEPSSSADVLKHNLYRKNLTIQNSNWEIIYTEQVDKQQSIFKDTALKANTKYRYAIFAEDEAGLISVPSTPVTITSSNKAPENLIKSFRGISNRENNTIELNWSIITSAKEIQLYKSKEDNKPILFRQFNINKKDFIDINISPNNKYVYTLKVKDNTGNIAFKKVEIIY